MTIAFAAPNSERGVIALGITLLFVSSLFIILMLIIWIIQPQGVDLLIASIILSLFAIFFSIFGIYFIVNRKSILERRSANAEKFI
ncbi:MAG: hypothetical protein ACTSRG_24675 [Candidatus Helarchaeota archaeon]